MSFGFQAQTFIHSEGRKWLERNKHKLPPKTDPVMTAIEQSKMEFSHVLEVGCADGWRLREIKKRWPKVECSGIDPGIPSYHVDRGIMLYRGTADSLHLFAEKQFDLIIYGFCLYLCDPQDYFDIAKEGDRVLKPGGWMVIWDFTAQAPFRKPYKHRDGLYAYHMDFPRLWLVHPAYSCRLDSVSAPEETATTVLLKGSGDPFPTVMS